MEMDKRAMMFDMLSMFSAQEVELMLTSESQPAGKKKNIFKRAIKFCKKRIKSLMWVYVIADEQVLATYYTTQSGTGDGANFRHNIADYDVVPVPNCT